MPKKDNDITDWYSKLGASSVKKKKKITKQLVYCLILEFYAWENRGRVNQLFYLNI